MAEAPGKWWRLKGLSAWQWSVLLTSPFILLLTRVRLRSRGFRKTLAWVSPKGESDLLPKEEKALAHETAYALAVAVKYGPWWPKCLVRSLALGWFLRRRGISFEVRIGVPAGRAELSAIGKVDFMAHAWVEVEGEVLNDKDDIARQYKAFEATVGADSSAISFESDKKHRG